MGDCGAGVLAQAAKSNSRQADDAHERDCRKVVIPKNLNANKNRPHVAAWIQT